MNAESEQVVAEDCPPDEQPQSEEPTSGSSDGRPLTTQELYVAYAAGLANG